MKAKWLSQQKGAIMWVEAAFVFPIVFIVVLLMIMAGEAAYQKARVQGLVSTILIDAAARCEDSFVDIIETSGSVPTTLGSVPSRPYRYLFSSDLTEIGNKVQHELEDKISKMTPLVFKGMKPTNTVVKVDVRAGLLLSSIQAECSFDVPLPIRIPFSKQNLKFHYEVYEKRQIGDAAEFVRNVSFVKNLLERYEAYNNQMQKMEEMLSKIAGYIN